MNAQFVIIIINGGQAGGVNLENKIDTVDRGGFGIDSGEKKQLGD